MIRRASWRLLGWVERVTGIVATPYDPKAVRVEHWQTCAWCPALVQVGWPSPDGLLCGQCSQFESWWEGLTDDERLVEQTKMADFEAVLRESLDREVVPYRPTTMRSDRPEAFVRYHGKPMWSVGR